MNRSILVLAAVGLASGTAFAATARPNSAHKLFPSSLEVGTVTGRPGQTVVVPIELRDQSGTPLGAERAAGERVQAISLRIVALPAHAVRSLSVRRAGATSALVPLFEARPTDRGSAGLLISFDERRAPLPLATHSRRGGALIAEVMVELAPDAKPGTRIELRLDPATTALANQQGTIAETSLNGWLELHDGLLRVAR